MIPLALIVQHKFSYDIITQAIVTYTPLSPPRINIKIHHIGIGAISQHPIRYSPFSWLNPDVLSNARSLLGLGHTLINSDMLPWLV